MTRFAFCFGLFACGVTTPTGGDGSGSNQVSACDSDNCVCASALDCSHTCTPGVAQCYVQAATAPVDVTCNNNGTCHVECVSAASCKVDCGGSTECQVTCPATGCTVKNCVGAACEVTCGDSGAAARSGTTASCT